MRKRYWFALVLAMVIPLLLWYWRPAPARDPRILTDSEVNEAERYSNILPEDYVGPETCAKCHKKNHERWSKSPHALMNQLPSRKSVQGNFENHVLELPTGKVTFTTIDGTYFMSVEKGGQPLRRYQVTRTVGSRYMQFYIGIQKEGPEARDNPLYGEHMLPFSYWITLGRWLPKPYFDPDGPEDLVDGIPQAEGIDKIRDVRPYNEVCMNCHNTYAYSYRIYHSMFAGFPDATVAATAGPLSRALAPTIDVKPTLDGFQGINGRLDPDRHLVSLGISCESCHFGGREHSQDPTKKIRFLPTSKYLRITPTREDRPLEGTRQDAVTINGICIQCHSGNAKQFVNGAAQCNSREGLDFSSGACASKMSCTNCHEPHTAGPRSGGSTDPTHLTVCASCHVQYADKDKALAHGRHSIAQTDCLDCHMPRQTLGLDALVRSHRVTKPVEESMVAKGSANACNLCHLDKSLNWTLKELDRGWKVKITPKADWDSSEILDKPIGDEWLKDKNPHMRVVASQSFARSPFGKSRLHGLIETLNDEESINRVYHQRAVEKVLGRKLSRAEYEMTAAPAMRKKQIEKLLATECPGAKK